MNPTSIFFKALSMRFTTYLVAIILLSLFSCDKNKDKVPDEETLVTTELSNGIGANTSKIHGYLYASIKKSISGGNYIYYYLRAFACFGDPARNLMSNFEHYSDNTLFFGSENQPNVTVGTVKFSNIQIGSKGSTTYNYSNNQSNPFGATSPIWDTEGNGPFKPFDVTVKRGFPQINLTVNGDTISRNTDFTINMANFISNYDSVVVKIYSGSITITKRISSASNTLTFKKEEFASFYTYANISYMAFNYSNMTVENKAYIFELSNKLEMPLIILN